LSNPEVFDGGQMLLRFGHTALQGGLAVAPLVGLLITAAVLAPLAIGGWTFSSEALVPQFSRLDPIAGFARVFSMRGVVELCKALARVLLVALVAIIVLRKQFHS
jgi:flagellar biosynthetic protein FlhB